MLFHARCVLSISLDLCDTKPHLYSNNDTQLNICNSFNRFNENIFKAAAFPVILKAGINPIISNTNSCMLSYF